MSEPTEYEFKLEGMLRELRKELSDALREIERLKAQLGDLLKMAYFQKVGSDTPHGLDCCDDYIDWLKSLQMPKV